MKVRYLRPIITNKEPNNKNVLWCHNGKISYFDGDWKECGNTEIASKDIQNAIKQEGSLYISTNCYIRTENKVMFNNYSDESLILSTLFTPFSIRCGGSVFFGSGSDFTTEPLYKICCSSSILTITSPNNPINYIAVSSSIFQIEIPNSIEERSIPMGSNAYYIVSKLLPSSYIQEEQDGLVIVGRTYNVSNNNTRMFALNLSTMQENPITVSTTNSSKWTLTDIQNILSSFEKAGYFTTKIN